MIKKIWENERKSMITLNILVLAMLAICYASSVYFHLPLNYGTDIRTQGYEFFTEFAHLMSQFKETGQLPFYSWSMFLGNNFWASKAFYTTGDPFMYLGLLIPGNFFDMNRSLSVLKFLIAANGFYLLLSTMNHKPFTKVVTSFVYTFSGWAIFFSGQTMFLSFYAMVPWYLLGIERYLKSGRWLLFTINAALLFSTNYLFFYTLSLLTIAYFSYRWFMCGNPKKGFWISAFKLIGYDILGMALSAFVWLPAILYIMGSGRFMKNIGVLQSPMVYLNMVYSLFVPNHLYLYRNNVLETGMHYNREICLYASAILVVLIPQVKKIYTEEQKKYTVLLYSFFALVLVFPIIASALQGFGDPSFRWVYFVVILNLYLMADVLDHYEELDPVLLKKSSRICCLVLITVFVLAFVISGRLFSQYLKHTIITVIFALLLLLSPCIYRTKKKAIILCCIFAELSISGFYTYYTDTRSYKRIEDYAYLNQVTHVLETYPGELTEAIRLKDESVSSDFYRVYVPLNDIYWDYSNNMSVFYDLQGLMTYDSAFNPSFYDLYRLVPSVNQYDSDWIFNIEDPDLMDYLSTKYAVVQSETEMDESRWELLDEGYLGYLKIYRNRNYRPFGITYSKWMSSDEYAEKENTALFKEYVIIDSEITDPSAIEPYLSDAEGYTYDTSHYGNTLTTMVHSDKDGYMVFSLPYDKGWKMLMDGQQISFDRVGGGMIGFRLPGGDHKIEMYFMPQGFKAGGIMAALSTLVIIALLIIQKRKK